MPDFCNALFMSNSQQFNTRVTQVNMFEAFHVGITPISAYLRELLTEQFIFLTDNLIR